MIEAKVRFVGKSPLSQSRPYQFDIPKKGQEKPDAYEARTWRHRLNTTPGVPFEEGHVVIPCVSIPNMLLASAKRLGMKFKGQSTFSSRFKGGLLCMEDLDLGVSPLDAKEERLFVPSDGKTGGGSRVLKIFPRFDAWSTEGTIIVMDDAITKEVLDTHLKYAGNFIGLGRFRPQNGGYYGRFAPEILSWKEKTDF